LHHRAEINLSEEIGALAKSFNEMSVALQTSFSKLQKTLESFEHFVPDKFLAVIAPEGIENIQVGVSATRTMTILFCDIRGYSSMAEQMTPQQTFSFLNDFLECMGLPIEESGGFIDKYIGDAIMALFDDEGTDSAVRAAILMQQTLSRFNEARMQKGLPAIAIGIGIHRGEVVMGTVGFTSRIDSTVVGDAVNLASRVEGLTKQYNCNILVTESVVKSLYHPESFCLGLVDKSVKVKGKDEAIAIYEVKL
jgi:class 3 adenylate cyclase